MERRVLAQLLDDRLGIGTLLEFLKDEHLILVSVVDGGLARGDAIARHDDRLHAHQELVIAVDACGGRNHHAPRAAIHREHRPRRQRRRWQQQQQRK